MLCDNNVIKHFFSSSSLTNIIYENEQSIFIAKNQISTANEDRCCMYTLLHRGR